MNKFTDLYSLAPSDSTDSMERRNYLNQRQLRIMTEEHSRHSSKSGTSPRAADEVACESSKRNNSATSAYTFPDDSDKHHLQTTRKKIENIDEDDLVQMLHRLVSLAQQGEDTTLSVQGRRSSGSGVLGRTDEPVSSDTRDSHAFHLPNTFQLSGMSLVDEQDILLTRYVDQVSSRISHDEVLDSDSDSDSDDSINVYKRRLGHRKRENIRKPVDQIDIELKPCRN